MLRHQRVCSSREPQVLKGSHFGSGKKAFVQFGVGFFLHFLSFLTLFLTPPVGVSHSPPQLSFNTRRWRSRGWPPCSGRWESRPPF